MSWTDHPSKSNPHTSTPEWKRVRRRVLKRDGGECQRCGDDAATHVDHRINLASLTEAERERIRYDEAALWSLCRRCHNAKTAREGAAASARSRSPKRRRQPVHPSDALS